MVNQRSVFEVLSVRCAADLGGDVGGQLVIVDTAPVRPGVTEVVYWTGTDHARTYSDAFETWLERGGLRVVKSYKEVRAVWR